jgi:hypothetical protein
MMNAPQKLAFPLRAVIRPIDNSCSILTATGAVIAYTRCGRPEEEARFLAHAANFHAALVEALEKASESLGFLEAETRRVGLEGYAIYALGARERIDLLLAQAKATIMLEGGA